MRLAAVCALLLSTATAHAFVPDDAPLVLARGGDAPRIARAVEPLTLGGWRATRDRDTGVVTRMWGSYVAAPGAQRDPAIAERAARAFLAQHLAALAPGAAIDDLVLASNRVDRDLRTVAFVQTHRGLRVVGGQLHVVFQRDRLFVAGSEALPAVRVAIPRTRAAASTARAAAWLPDATLRATGERVILPIVTDRGVSYHVADRVAATSARGRWDVYVAPDGAPIARARTTHHATSTLRYDVGVRHATGARAPVDAARAAITVDAAPTTTAADGTFSWPTAAPATVIPAPAGTHVQVANDAGPLATASLVAQPGQPVVWSAATDEHADAQLSAFVYASNAKAAARRIHPTLAWLDQPLEVHVNLDDSCNAFSTGDSIHFFRADAECQNTARVADVVHHELAHSFHQQALIPGAGAMDASIVEGIADFFAANMTGDPGIGRGFFFDDSAVRDLDPLGVERASPADLSLVPHVTGLIIGGALWDLRTQLVAQLGEAEGVRVTEQIFLGIIQRAPDLTATYVAALTAADDDGDLGNGTPHACTIENAFGRHGLAGPDFRTTTVGRPTVDGLTISARVETPTGTACAPPTVTAMTLTWAIGDGPEADLAMTAQGATWTAAIPPQPDGTVVRYRVRAALSDGARYAYPDNPADPMYQLFVGTATPIWCESFDADPRWKQTGAAEWDWGVPTSDNTAAGDPAAPFTGTAMLGTDVKGDGRYRPDIMTTVETPLVDATRYARVHLQFRRWLTVEDAGNDVATIRVNDQQVWANASTTARTLAHVDREWRFVDVDLTAHAHAPLAVSWTLATDPDRNLGGWTLDDVCVVGLDKRPTCGDNVLDDGEACDDGNVTDGDGCADSCTLESDDGGCCSTGGDPTGPLLLGLVLLGLSRRSPRVRVPSAPRLNG